MLYFSINLIYWSLFLSVIVESFESKTKKLDFRNYQDDSQDEYLISFY